MKKLLLLIFGTLIALPAMTQTGTQLVEISRIFKHIDINITPGLTYKWPIGPEFDTARYFQHNGKRYIATVTFTEIGGPVEPPPTNETITHIDNVPSDSRNKYSPGWTHRSGANWLVTFHDETASHHKAAGSTFTVDFVGYKVEWFGEKLVNHGRVGIRIDDEQKERIIDAYDRGTVNNSQILFTRDSLTNGPHKITFRVLGTKQAAATDHSIVHDKLVVYKK